MDTHHTDRLRIRLDVEVLLDKEISSLPEEASIPGMYVKAMKEALVNVPGFVDIEKVNRRVELDYRKSRK